MKLGKMMEDMAFPASTASLLRVETYSGTSDTHHIYCTFTRCLMPDTDMASADAYFVSLSSVATSNVA